jgi:hypothetical protein
MESMLYAFHTEGLEILSPLFHVKRESDAPTEDELHTRTNHEEGVKENESAAEGLTMFDNLSEE